MTAIRPITASALSASVIATEPTVVSAAARTTPRFTPTQSTVLPTTGETTAERAKEMPTAAPSCASVNRKSDRISTARLPIKY